MELPPVKNIICIDREGFFYDIVRLELLKEQKNEDEVDSNREFDYSKFKISKYNLENDKGSETELKMEQIYIDGKSEYEIGEIQRFMDTKRFAYYIYCCGVFNNTSISYVTLKGVEVSMRIEDFYICGTQNTSKKQRRK